MVFQDLTVVAADQLSSLVSAANSNDIYLRANARSDVPLTSMATGEIQSVSTAAAAKPDSLRYCTAGSETSPTTVKLGDAGIRFDESVIRADIVNLSTNDEVVVCIIPDTTLKRTVRRCRLISDTVTTSDGTDHWQFDLLDKGTTGAAGTSLLTAQLDTNGDDWATAFTAKSLSIQTAASANVLAHSRVITLKATKNAAADTIARLTIILELEGQ